jgi:hypothetical protein
MAGGLLDYIMNRILSEVRSRVKVGRSSHLGLKRRTLERIELDETAVGTMGIERTSQGGLSRGEEKCAVAGVLVTIESGWHLAVVGRRSNLR